MYWRNWHHTLNTSCWDIWPWQTFPSIMWLKGSNCGIVLQNISFYITKYLDFMKKWLLKRLIWSKVKWIVPKPLPSNTFIVLFFLCKNFPSRHSSAELQRIDISKDNQWATEAGLLFIQREHKAEINHLRAASVVYGQVHISQGFQICRKSDERSPETEETLPIRALKHKSHFTALSHPAANIHVPDGEKNNISH